VIQGLSMLHAYKPSASRREAMSSIAVRHLCGCSPLSDRLDIIALKYRVDISSERWQHYCRAPWISIHKNIIIMTPNCEKCFL